MQKETVTFDKLPEAVGYLTEQIIELKRMVSELQPPASDKHVLVEIELLTFLIGRKQPFAYQCINGRLGFSDDTASILNFNQHVFV